MFQAERLVEKLAEEIYHAKDRLGLLRRSTMALYFYDLYRR